METFDEAEVREIGLGETSYPELLKAMRTPPEYLRVRGNLPPNLRNIAISGSRKPHRKHCRQHSASARCLQNTDIPLSRDSPKAATKLLLKARFPKLKNVIGVVPRGLKALPTHTNKSAQEIFATGGAVISEYPDNFSKVFPRHYLRRNEIITGLSEKTIIIAARERSGSSATANRAFQQGREVIITPHVTAKIEGATIVRNLGELKDALGIDRQDLKK